MAYRLEWVGDVERFEALAPQWDALAQLDPTPFARHAWFSAWWAAFATRRLRLRTLALWSGDELAAVFPLAAAGRSLQALANVHTPVFRPLAVDEQARAALADAVMEATPAVLHVPALPAGDPAATVVADSARRRGLLTVTVPQHTSPTVDTSGTFEDYRAAMRPKLAEHERRRRKMQRDHEAELVLVDPAAPTTAALAALERGLQVEARGWKGRAGTAVLSSSDTAAFYRSVARRYGELGQLSLSWIALDGRMVAFDLALLDRGSYHLLKTTYDEEFRSLGPGMVLRLAVIERCFELGLQAHEFLGDDMAWKRTFSTGERHHVACHAYRRHPEGVARYAYRSFARPVLAAGRRRLRR